jgi:hypothetical protein
MMDDGFDEKAKERKKTETENANACREKIIKGNTKSSVLCVSVGCFN